MTRLLLKLRYGYEMAQAYLASHMRDQPAMQLYLDEADKTWMKIWKETRCG